jgi:beta-1,4-N-acetylglucosaminyltransferase
MSNPLQSNDHSITEKVLFVTVGTTLFTSLIDAIVHVDTISYMRRHHFTHLIIQYGKDTKPNIAIHDSKYDLPDQQQQESLSPSQKHLPLLQIELYDFKSSLLDDMKRAHLIVCHAGAGTLTEAIRISQQQPQICNGKYTKKIVTVINTKLMDNHQTELAYALQRRQLVYVVDDPIALSQQCTWEQIESFLPNTTTSSLLHDNPYDIPRILHHYYNNDAVPVSELDDAVVPMSHKEE